jgi:hypothetical protein
MNDIKRIAINTGGGESLGAWPVRNASALAGKWVSFQSLLEMPSLAVLATRNSKLEQNPDSASMYKFEISVRV